MVVQAGGHAWFFNTGAVTRPDRDCGSGRFGDARSLLRTLHRHVGNAIAHGQPPNGADTRVTAEVTCPR